MEAISLGATRDGTRSGTDLSKVFSGSVRGKPSDSAVAEASITLGTTEPCDFLGARRFTAWNRCGATPRGLYGLAGLDHGRSADESRRGGEDASDYRGVGDERNSYGIGGFSTCGMGDKSRRISGDFYCEDVLHSAGREVATYSRRATNKRMDKDGEIQNEHVTHGHSSAPAERFSVEARYHGRLPPYRDGRSGSLNVSLAHKRSHLSHERTYIWDRIGTEDIHQNSSNSVGRTTLLGNRHHGVSRRHFRLEFFTHAGILPRDVDGSAPHRVRLQDQFQEVGIRTIANSGIVRLDVRPEEDGNVPSVTQADEISTSSPELCEESDRVTQSNGQSIGDSATYVDGDEIYSTDVSAIDDGVQSRNGNDCPDTGDTVRFDRDPHELGGMESSFTSSNDVRFHPTCGRERLRLGGEYSDDEEPLTVSRRIRKQSVNPPVVSNFQRSHILLDGNELTDRTHSHIGVGDAGSVGDVAGRSAEGSGVAGEQGENTVRQCSHSVLHQSLRSITQSSSSESGLGFSGMVQAEADPGARVLVTQQSECSGGLGFSTTAEQARLDDPSSAFCANRPVVGPASDRSVLIRGISSSTSVLQFPTRSFGYGDGCIHNDVDTISLLGEPAMDTDSGYTQQGPVRKSLADTPGASLADASVVSHLIVPAMRLSNLDSSPTGHIPTTGGGQRAPTPPVLETDGSFSAFRITQSEAGFSHDVITQAQAAWRDTRRLRATDEGFRSWLLERKLDPVRHNTFPVALRYLQHLREDKGYRYPQLRVVKSALSGLFGESPAFGMKTLGDLLLTKKLMRSYREQDVFVERPKYTRFWDPQIIHDYILLQPTMKDWSLNFTTKILAYLLKEGIAGRSSDVVRMDRSSLRASLKPSEYFLVDIRAPKDTGNDSSASTVRRRRIYMNRSTDKRLHWLEVLQFYESFDKIRTAKSRFVQTPPFLFTFGGSNPGEPPKSDTITRWVAEIMFRAGVPEEFSPHSVRGAVVTDKIRKGFLAEIQDVFASETTRKKHYDRSEVPAVTVEEGARLRTEREGQKWKFRSTTAKEPRVRKHTQAQPSDSADSESEADEVFEEAVE